MSEEPVATTLSDLDFEAAWRRVKWDRHNRVFVTFALEEDLLDFGFEEWVQVLRTEVTEGRYSPGPCEICEVPKVGFHLRPGSRLDTRDHLVYTALIQALYPGVRERILAGRAQKDYAYLLRSATDVPWFQPPFGGWRGFQKAAVDRVTAGANAVLFADVSGYYENIDLARLRYMLQSMGAPQPILDLLFRCLYTWAEPRGRGIPQGYSASDLLGKVYLDRVDLRLERDGFDHLRYVDDFRVFCDTLLDAKKALNKLTALLRECGLNLETKKTEPVDADPALTRIRGKIPELETTRDQLVAAVRAEGFSNPYLRASDLAQLEQQQADVARAVLERAFVTHILEPNDRSFDSTLFHYLMVRLGEVRSTTAIDFALAQLRTRPEETEYVLQYLANFLNDDTIGGRVIEFAESGDSIYDFQRYQIVGWLLKNGSRSEEGLRLCRAITGERSHQLWLRSVAMAYLGLFGDAPDLESIEALYSAAASDLERALILCSVRRMPAQRRNSLYARHETAGSLNAFAVRWAKQHP